MKKVFITAFCFILFVSMSLSGWALGDNPPKPAPDPVIIDIKIEPTAHTQGNVQVIDIRVDTSNISDGNVVSAKLLMLDAQTEVAGVNSTEATLKGNKAQLSLGIPTGIQAGSYRIKVGINALGLFDTSTVYTINENLAGDISLVEVSPNGHTEGSIQEVSVAVHTANIQNNTMVTVGLVDENGTAVEGVNIASGNIMNGTANIKLTIPGSVPKGDYKIKTTVGSLSDSSSEYVINSTINMPRISTITVSSSSQYYGSGNAVTVGFTTQQVNENTGFEITLINSTGALVDGISGTGLITGSQGSIDIAIPGSLPVGQYYFKMEVSELTLNKTSAVYSVIAPVPVITSVDTSGAVLTEGYVSGSITVVGDRFGEDPIVKVVNRGNGSETAVLPTLSGSSILFDVPAGLQAGTYTVKVTNSSYTTESTQYFTIITQQVTPSITDIEISAGSVLTQGSISGSLIIKGTNFSDTLSNNKISIYNSDTNALIMQNLVPSVKSTSSITVSLPSALPAGTYKVKVKVDKESGFSNNTFTIEKGVPQITGLDTSAATLVEGSIDGSIVILGKHYIPTNIQNKISIVNSQGSVVISDITPITSASSFLVFNIPDLAAGQYRVQVASGSKVSAISTVSFTVAKVSDKGGEDGGGNDNGGNNDNNGGNVENSVGNVSGGSSSGTVITPPKVDGPETSLDIETGIFTTTYNTEQIQKLIRDENKAVDIILEKVDGTSKQSLKLSSDAVSELVQKGKDIQIHYEGSIVILPVDLLRSITGDFAIDIGEIAADVMEQMTSIMDMETGESVQGAGGAADISVKEGESPLTSFANPLIITLTLSDNADARKSGIFYWDEGKKRWTYIGGEYDPVTGQITCVVDHLTRFAVLERNKTFTDIENSWAKEYIEVLASRYIIGGISEDAYSPKGKITRSQFAKLLVEALGIETSEVKGLFTDCAKNAWYTPYVEAAKEAGIAGGTGNSRFEPEAEITREQMAVMVMNALKFKIPVNMAQELENYNTNLTDVDKMSSWAKDAVLCANARGIITGNPDKSFDPQGDALREQAAVVIYRLLIELGQVEN